MTDWLPRIYYWLVDEDKDRDGEPTSPLNRYPHDVLRSRIWELRNNLSAYDAAYVALAEALDAPLVSCDRALANASGHRAKVLVF